MSIERFPIPPDLVEHILLGPTDDRRVLQDSPVLGDVWLAYAADPGGRADLLITPHREVTPGKVAARITRGKQAMDKRLKKKKRPVPPGLKIAFLQGIVAAELTFEEMLVILVPLTYWWGAREEKEKNTLASDPGFWRKVHKLLEPASFWRAQRRLQGVQESGDEMSFSSLERYVALAGPDSVGGRSAASGRARARPETGARRARRGIRPL